MADYRATSTEFTAVADAIRTKGGTSAQLTWPNGFVSAVNAIPTGGGGDSLKLRPVSILNSSDILCEYDGLNFMPSDNNLLYGSITDIPGFHLFPSRNNSKLGYDLGEANHSATAYVIGKMLNYGGDYQIIGFGYGNSGGNAPNIFSNGSYFYSSVYGDDTSTGKPYNKFVLFTLSVNSATKKARYYADGVFLAEKSFTNSGRYASFGCGLLNDGSIANMRETSLLYIAVVDGVESDETILANHTLLLQRYSNYIGT